MAQVSYELTLCPVCASGQSAELADADQMRSEMELLWAFHDRRLKRGVPPDRLTDRLAFSQRPPLRLAECKQCDHIYRNPRERKETLKSAYTSAEPDPAVLEALFSAQRKTSRRQVRRLTRIVRHPGRGLEVGSYSGGFLAAANDAGWTFEGLDLSEAACAFGRDRGLRVSCGEIEGFEGGSLYDVIAVWNTFEQLYDARAALAAAHRLLKAGGILALRFPNGGFYRAWRRRLAGAFKGVALRLLAHNNLLGFPYRQGFTSSSLGALLDASGFALGRVWGDTLARVADQWTTRYGTLEERWVKRVERRVQPGWRAPWVEVYARRR